MPHSLGVLSCHRETRVTPFSRLLSWELPFIPLLLTRGPVICGQVTAGGTQPRHDNTIGWEDPGRWYGRNGVKISPVLRKTHFLMHNKDFTLSAVIGRLLWLKEQAGGKNQEAFFLWWGARKRNKKMRKKKKGTSSGRVSISKLGPNIISKNFFPSTGRA